MHAYLFVRKCDYEHKNKSENKLNVSWQNNYQMYVDHIDITDHTIGVGSSFFSDFFSDFIQS